MKIFRSVLLMLCIGAFLQLPAEEKLLNVQDIPKIMQQIFDQHLDHKKMTPKLLHHAIIAYIDHFDPKRTYLLQSEVVPYLNLNENQLNVLLQKYQANNFEIFKQLDNTIQKSIHRSRGLRLSIEQVPEKLFQSKKGVDAGDGWEDPDLKLAFAKTDLELQERIKKEIISYINYEKKRFGDAAIISHEKETLAQLEENLREQENTYLYRNSDNQQLGKDEAESLFAEHVLKSIAGSLDAHTTFYSRSEAYDVKTRLQKEFSGVGIALQKLPDGAISISGMAPKGPAALSGKLEIGDRLIEIDGKKVANDSLDKVSDMLHGDKGAELRLGVRRKDKSDPSKEIAVNVVLKRAEITLDTDRVDLSYRPYNGGVIGIITLHSFYQGSNGVDSESDVKEAIEKLRKIGPIYGLILDLRENSGGFLGQAVKVAGLFITNGVVVISKYFNGEQHFYRDLDSEDYYDGPLIVLTSRATASAAEIVAQALQDYGVALIVGDEQTYGKGTIQNQTVTDNKSSSFFKVTVGRYYTVSGKTPQLNGVKADIVVPGIFAYEHIGERFLPETVPTDMIESDYDDHLDDVSIGAKAWFLQYYVPTMQHQVSRWRELLPGLKSRSTNRLIGNSSYQRFLANLKKGFIEAGEQRDFQLDEAVNIIEDMSQGHILNLHK